MRTTTHANSSGGRYYRIESPAVRTGHIVRANNRGQAFHALGIALDEQHDWFCAEHRTAREAHRALERSLEVLRIRHPNGTYYAGPSGIGPRFGATVETAFVFADESAAARAMAHWAFADCTVERGIAR